MTNIVAVYGSLRKGMGNHHCLDGATYISEGVLQGFGMYSMQYYPALSELGEKTNVIVELYSVDENGLGVLDMLEGYPSFYNRKIVTVQTPNGDVDALVYYIEDDLSHLDFVLSGDWVKYYKGKYNE